ncbi:MAG TPA: hypothetical protein VN855_00080, partial [Candidatus Acidoferrum sp.]|nr:hypothetical protein [Candidatus Acidoferrum sp.]
MPDVRKSLEVSIMMDSSQVGPAIENLKRQLDNITRTKDQAQMAGRMSQQGFGGILSVPKPEDIQKSKRALDQFIVEQGRMQERTFKLIAGQEEKLKAIHNINKEDLKTEKEKLDFKNKEKSVTEELIRLKRQLSEGGAMQSKALDMKKEGAPGGLSDIVKNFKSGLVPIMAAFGAVMAASKFADNLAGYNMRLEGARGSAIAGTAGAELSNIYGGRSPFEAIWAPEKEKASGMAKKKAGVNKFLDFLPGLAGPLGVLLGGDRSRAAFLSPKEHEQLLASQQAQDRQKMIENLKNADPGKRLALDEFEKNYRNDLRVQRTLGLSHQQFYGTGGFKARGAAAGFLPEQMMEMGQGIVGAGGSSRMGAQAGFGLQMERGGLTNASQILGTLSGGIQSPESSKRAVIGILSEAFKIGLDNTNFAEENRRFAQAASAVIGRSGATKAEDQDRLAQTLGMFLGERTNRGVEAATTAYERFQERSSALGGRRGAMRFAAARKNRILGKFKTDDLSELLGARPEQLRTDSAFLQSYAAEAGVAPEDILSELQNVSKQSRIQIPGRRRKVNKLVDRLSEYMKDQGISYQELVERSRRGGLDTGTMKDFGTLQRYISEENPEKFNVADIEAQTGEFFAAPGQRAADTEAA